MCQKMAAEDLEGDREFVKESIVDLVCKLLPKLFLEIESLF